MRNKWVIGGLVVATAAVVAYFAAPKPKPVAPAPPAQAEAPPSVPPAPVMLPAVVDVLDVDPLLDPPPIPPADVAPSGVVVTTLDDEPPAAPLQPNSAPAFIPPAADDTPVAGDGDEDDCDEEEVREEPAIEVAPMPREVRAGIPSGWMLLDSITADAARRGWYGEHRLPRQLGMGLSSEQLRDELERIEDTIKPRCRPGGVNNGIEFRF